MSDLLTFEEYRRIGLQEQHAEIDVARAIISESYTAAAMRLGIPACIDTGKFRPKKGDAIRIRVDKVVNEHPWNMYKKKYIPQHDHSFLSRAFVRVHPGYCDFLIRFYTSRYRTPAPQVQRYLELLAELTSAEKIMREKWLGGPKAFAFPAVYEIMDQCYHLRDEYAARCKAINSLAKRYGWNEIRREAERLLARREIHQQTEQVRQMTLTLPVEPLPSGLPRILLLPIGGEEGKRGA